MKGPSDWRAALAALAPPHREAALRQALERLGLPFEAIRGPGWTAGAPASDPSGEPDPSPGAPGSAAPGGGKPGPLAVPEPRRPGHHLLVGPFGPRTSRRPPLLLAAHHDTVPGTPGANDNGAAVAHLLALLGRQAARERSPGRTHDLRRSPEAPQAWGVVFTAGEELPRGRPPEEQGAFGLAQHLAGGFWAQARVWVLDLCGRGDTVVLSRGIERLWNAHTGPNAPAGPSAPAGPGIDSRGKAPRGHREGDPQGGGGAGRPVSPLDPPWLARLEANRREARRFLSAAAPGAWVEAPTPFSDDLGFLAAGWPAVLLSSLPGAEAAAYARQAPDPAGPAAAQAYPPAWQTLHGPDDRPESLSPEAGPLWARWLDALTTFPFSADLG